MSAARKSIATTEGEESGRPGRLFSSRVKSRNFSSALRPSRFGRVQMDNLVKAHS